MNPILIYLLEVSICLTLLYSVYLIIKSETFHHLKRYYLIFTVLISLIIPQISLPKIPSEIAQQIVNTSNQNKSNITYYDTFEKVTFGQILENKNSVEKKLVFNWLNLLGIIYLIGVLYFLYRFVINIFHIYRLYRHNQKHNYLDYKIILLQNEYSTFSFFNCIFFNNENLSEEDGNNILLHEIAHIQQKHTIDILFIEICRIMLWFNPFIWLYKSSIVKVHECLADQYFAKNKPDNLINYQTLLLEQYLSKINIELAHPFNNYSLIKFRIHMMTKNKSKWWAKYKLIFALPIIAIGLFAFSNAKLNLDEKTNNNDYYHESPPYGMLYIPQGSFTLKRSDGKTTKELNVKVDPFWMKETEVRVEEYSCYLESLRKDSTKQVYKAALPNFDNAPYKGYFVKDEYKSYPMVGVSLLQAQNYCRWKTRKENQELKREGKHIIADYRIPTEAEWVFASFGGLKPDEIIKPENPGLIEIRRGRSIKKDLNDFGLIYMFSNISEWTNTAFEAKEYLNKVQIYPDKNPENIVVRGDNFKKELINDKLILNGNNSYEYVGFRYVRSYLGQTKN